jgi:Helix-turn-helix domain
MTQNTHQTTTNNQSGKSIIIHIETQKQSKEFSILVIPEIQKLNNLNPQEKTLLAVVTQLDNKDSCFAQNYRLAKILNCGERYVQKMLLHLEKLGYITRTIATTVVDGVKFYSSRIIKSIFSVFYKNKKNEVIQKNGLESRAYRDELEGVHKENINIPLTKESKILTKKEKIQIFLDEKLTESEQVEYFEYISKKRDYNLLTVESMFNHSGWVLWFKNEQRNKNKGIAIGNMIKNATKGFGFGVKKEKKTVTGGMFAIGGNEPTRADMEARRNMMLKGLGVV